MIKFCRNCNIIQTQKPDNNKINRFFYLNNNRRKINCNRILAFLLLLVFASKNTNCLQQNYPINARHRNLPWISRKNYQIPSTVHTLAGQGFDSDQATEPSRKTTQARKRVSPKRMPNFMDSAMLQGLNPETLVQERVQLNELTPEVSKHFERIVEAMLECEEVVQLGPILATEVDFLLTHNATQLMENLKAQADDEKEVEVLSNVFEAICDFLETVVNQTAEIWKRHQSYMKEIIEAAKEGPEQLDTKLKKLSDTLDVSFLDYLDHEVSRLSQEEEAPMLPIMMTVRSRVLTEIEKGLGAEVAVLSKLVQYDDEHYRALSLKRYFKDSNVRTQQNFVKLVTATLDDMEQRQIDGDGLRLRLKHIKQVLAELV